ncbi:calmodulin-like protein 3 [Cynara cardunculus var. scolymus]|uniref:Calcium-binding EF-hand n=1 Tax=Cynara cardunculus var. scolymus TaxID=59895 RepID=A0A124SCH5_CYNCS|nr:calmodulin-like protein 3 [Cynara cardunculus var. scolymus]KVH93817.1 Calcium-binding EF-hand [Cynara cardunculus var. scolymus]
MAILTIVFLLLLFVIGLFSTLSRIPTKKIAVFFQEFQSSSSRQDSVKSKDQKKKMVTKKKGSLDSDHSREKKAELKSVFATFDKNKDGFITKQELSDSLKNIGISTSERDVLEMVQKVDVNGDGLIDFDEFCELFESMMSREDQGGSKIDGGVENLDHEDGDLKDAFDVFDGDKNGLISVEELGKVLDSLGFKEGKKLEDCKMMISKVDIDGDGMINFHEFKNMMKNGISLISVS